MSTPILVEPRRSNLKPIIGIILVAVLIIIIIIVIYIFFINGSTASSSTGTSPTAGCTSNAGCSNGQQCKITGGFGVCVSCQSNTDCKDPTKPICFTTNGVCTECRSPSDCKDPTKPVCNPNRSVCTQCLTNSDCTTNPNGVFCDPTSETCKQCLQNTDCGDVNKACDFNTGNCVDAFTCPTITVPSCNGQAIAGFPGATYCADGLQEYECVSPGNWVYDGNSCTCPTQEYFVYNGVFHDNGLSQFSNITNNTDCQAICTPDTSCVGTTWNPDDNTCHTFTFPGQAGYTAYIADPNRSGVYITYTNTPITDNDVITYSGISLQQCFANCGPSGAATAIVEYQDAGQNCSCKNPDVSGGFGSTNSNWLTSFKEFNG
jgi:hypothetical protein